jgi:hypothetical protein
LKPSPSGQIHPDWAVKLRGFSSQKIVNTFFSISANYADSANHAVLANTAKYALTADTANSALLANNAKHAILSDTAEYARGGSAVVSAQKADSAGKSANADSLGRNPAIDYAKKSDVPGIKVNAATLADSVGKAGRAKNADSRGGLAASRYLATDTAGNVGIGTSPNYQLHVNGTGYSNSGWASPFELPWFRYSQNSGGDTYIKLATFSGISDLGYGTNLMVEILCGGFESWNHKYEKIFIRNRPSFSADFIIAEKSFPNCGLQVFNDGGYVIVYAFVTGSFSYVSAHVVASGWGGQITLHSDLPQIHSLPPGTKLFDSADRVNYKPAIIINENSPRINFPDITTFVDNAAAIAAGLAPGAIFKTSDGQLRIVY